MSSRMSVEVEIALMARWDSGGGRFTFLALRSFRTKNSAHYHGGAGIEVPYDLIRLRFSEIFTREIWTDVLVIFIMSYAIVGRSGLVWSGLNPTVALSILYPVNYGCFFFDW